LASTLTQEEESGGTITRVAGPVVTAKGLSSRMNDVVYVGEEELMGEVIEIEQDRTVIQVYEETAGIAPGEPVRETGQPLTVELGPGLLSSIYDGIQRPLQILQDKMGDFILRGVTAPGVDREATWDFEPEVEEGDEVAGGDVIGIVEETPSVDHKILVPPETEGTIASIEEGSYTVEDTVATLEDGTELNMLQKWPVREPRPINDKLRPEVPLVTGQRILDSLFPVAKGGTAAIPGPFGSGKTVTQQQLAKWSDADIVIYVGCGERGNEMTEVIEDFPELEDPQTGNALMDRTILVANTSNMPVAAREACVYTGITLGEYYRDQGLDVSLMADSTSRWAEAMREISSRLEEMPGEEGFPAYLAARIAEFYERAGRVETLKGDVGSVTVIGAVSPPGGDFSEPVTQNTLRIVKTFWALDSDLSQRRHFPAINWLDSYSLYEQNLMPTFDEEVDEDWSDNRAWAIDLLQEESELQDIVQLVGSDALPEDQQLILEVARMVREVFLQQNAFHEVDTYSPLEDQFKLLDGIRTFDDLAHDALESGVPVDEISNVDSRHDYAQLVYEEDFDEEHQKVMKQMESDFEDLGGA
jgi:V/A-type H+-transporting ATPase subunit A